MPSTSGAKQEFLNSLKKQLIELNQQATPLKRHPSPQSVHLEMKLSPDGSDLTDYYPQRRLANDFTVSHAAKRRSSQQNTSQCTKSRPSSRGTKRNLENSTKKRSNSVTLAFGRSYKPPTPIQKLVVEAPKRYRKKISKVARSKTPKSTKKKNPEVDTTQNDLIWMRQQQQIEELTTKQHTMRKQMKKIIREIKKMNQILPVENLQQDMDNIIQHQKQMRGFVRSRMRKLIENMSNVNQDHSHQRVEMEKLQKIYSTISKKTNQLELDMNQMKQETHNDINQLKRDTDHRLCNLEQKNELFETQMQQMRKIVFEKTRNLDYWRESLQTKREELKKRSQTDRKSAAEQQAAALRVDTRPAAASARDKKAASRRDQYIVDVEMDSSSEDDEKSPPRPTQQRTTTRRPARILDSSSEDEESLESVSPVGAARRPQCTGSAHYNQLKRAYLRVFRNGQELDESAQESR